MVTSAQIPLGLTGLTVTKTQQSETEVTISVMSNAMSVDCPFCGASSTSFHSSYMRHVQDTPIGLWMVWLLVMVRRFRCRNPKCKRKTFAEQHPLLFGRRKRRTNRLLLSVTQIGLALGGEGGARLTRKLSMTTSASTVLRLLHQLEVPEVKAPVTIGIDDWAFRKGTSYGTIIVDHETGKPIDLLPERDSETVEKWLEMYPTIVTVTRDRSGEYREAITDALPDAVQIADRWHLLKNLREAVKRHISRRYSALKKLVVESAESEEEKAATNEVGRHRRYNNGPSREALQQARKQSREALFAAIKERHEAGAYVTDLAKEFNLSRRIVTHWVKCDEVPPDTRGRYKTKCLIDDYVPYIRQRLDAGCTNQSQIWREIQEQGFTGARTLVGKWIRQNYYTHGQSSQKVTPKKVECQLPRSTELSWMLIRRNDELDEDELMVVKKLLADEKLAEFRQQAHKFMQMIRNRLHEQWDDWIDLNCVSTVQELKNFVIGLKKDSAAVYQAVKQEWSNGRTEGHVNKLKLIKRQMYGRASFKLLRIRVLLAH